MATGDDDGRKSPRGIRFSEEGYQQLKDACLASGSRHLDDFILGLIEAKKKQAALSALIRENRTEIVREIRDIVTEEVPRILEKLLEKYTR